MTPYKERPVRFVEIIKHNNWTIKLYTISNRKTFSAVGRIADAKSNLSRWLENAGNYPLENYKLATLILHECREGCFAIISWWVDENMLQIHVYLSTPENPSEFKLFSDRGISTCVWEMAVLWFERNAWVEHVLKNPANPDFDSYLNRHLNSDV